MYSNAQLRQDLRLRGQNPNQLEAMSQYILTLMKRHRCFRLAGFGVFSPPHFRLDQEIECRLYLRSDSEFETENAITCPNRYQDLTSIILDALKRFQSINIDFKGVGRLTVMQRIKYYQFSYESHVISALRTNSQIAPVFDTSRSKQLPDPATLYWNEKLAAPIEETEYRAESAKVRTSHRDIVEINCDRVLKHCTSTQMLYTPLRLSREGPESRISTLRGLEHCDISFDQVRKAVKEQAFGKLHDEAYEQESAERKESKNRPRSPEMCCKCYWERDIRNKQEEAKERKLEVATDPFKSLHEQNDLRNAGFCRKSSEAQRENQARARSTIAAKDAYRRSGHYNAQGVLLENAAVLSDPLDLVETMRSVNRQYMAKQVEEAERDAQRRGHTDEQLEDYLNRKNLEIDIEEEENQLKTQRIERQRQIALLLEEEADSCTIGEIPKRCDNGEHLTSLFEADDKAEINFRRNETSCKEDNFVHEGDIKSRSMMLRCEEKEQERDDLASKAAEDDEKRAAIITMRNAQREKLEQDMELKANVREARAARVVQDKRTMLDGYRFYERDIALCEECDYH